MLTTVQNIPVF